MTDAKEPLVRYGYRLCVRDDSAHRGAERAVIEAAKAFAARPSLITEQVLIGFVSTLRALEGHA
jgi:hypothetical protein